MSMIITFAIGLLTGSFLTIFCVAASDINHREGANDTGDEV